MIDFHDDKLGRIQVNPKQITYVRVKDTYYIEIGLACGTKLSRRMIGATKYIETLNRLITDR